MSKECTEKILDQIDNSICKIKGNEGKTYMGLLCLIKCQDEIIYFLLTKYQIINGLYLEKKNHIEVYFKEENITLEFSKIKYFDKSLDLSIIEIKKIKNKKIKYIEFDDYLYVKDSEVFYYKESIYMIYYGNKDIYISYGIINNINKSELRCSCNLYSNSSGFPIFNLSNNKLIGLYETKSDYFIKGIFLKFIINELIKEIKYGFNYELKYNNNIKNEINILINVEKDYINKKIYILDNYEYKDNNGIIHIHDNLKELNEFNTELYIDKKKEKYENILYQKKKEFLILI